MFANPPDEQRFRLLVDLEKEKILETSRKIAGSVCVDRSKTSVASVCIIVNTLDYRGAVAPFRDDSVAFLTTSRCWLSRRTRCVAECRCRRLSTTPRGRIVLECFEVILRF